MFIAALAESSFKSYDKRLLAEKADLLFFHLRGVLIGNVGIALLMILVLWPAVAAAKLLVWFATILSVSILRFIIAQRLSQQPTKPADADQKMFFHLSFVLLSGCIWGVGGLLFMTPDNPGYLAFLLLILAGMTAGCLASYATFPPLYFAYAVPTIVPIASYLIVTNNNVVPVAGYFMAAFLTINLFYCRNLGRAIENSLSLQFENIELMDQLREQKDIAESSNIAKSKFLAAASHDLRQPIHALGLFINVLENNTTEQKSLTLVERIKQSVEALSSLFHSLLDISKLDAGIVEVEKSHFEVCTVINKLIAELEPSAQAKGLKLELLGDTQIIHTDKVLTERILRNLIANAIRYTQAGSITLSATNTDSQVILSVSDTGIGIPLEQQEEIYSEYHQLNNPERDREKGLGLGLGLAIVKRLTDLLDLELSLTSKVGEGSTFSVLLPAGDASLIKEHETQHTPWDLKDTKVVVIDDELDILSGMEEILANWGCEMILADSSASALKQLKAKTMIPDLILSDYRLRDHKTGAEAITDIERYCNRSIPAILITGDTSADRLAEAKSSGHRLLHKPISPPQLRTAVHQEVGASHSRD